MHRTKLGAIMHHSVSKQYAIHLSFVYNVMRTYRLCENFGPEMLNTIGELKEKQTKQTKWA